MGIKELDLQILIELNDVELKSLCKTNKYYQELCRNEELWKQKIYNRFGTKIGKEILKVNKEKSPKSVYSLINKALNAVQKLEDADELATCDSINVVNNIPIKFLPLIFGEIKDFDKKTSIMKKIKASKWKKVELMVICDYDNKSKSTAILGYSLPRASEEDRRDLSHALRARISLNNRKELYDVLMKAQLCSKKRIFTQSYW